MTVLAPGVPSTGLGSPSGGIDMLWVLHAPCDCITGWMATSIPGKGALLDEQDAWEESPYGPVRTSRMRAEGWQWIWEPAETAYAGMRRECPHTPRFLSSAFDLPDGYTWAARTQAAKLEHLVWDWEEDFLRDDPNTYASSDVAPLCSSEATGPWWRVSRADPCPECEREAQKLADR